MPEQTVTAVSRCGPKWSCSSVVEKRNSKTESFVKAIRDFCLWVRDPQCSVMYGLITSYQLLHCLESSFT